MALRPDKIPDKSPMNRDRDSVPRAGRRDSKQLERGVWVYRDSIDIPPRWDDTEGCQDSYSI